MTRFLKKVIPESLRPLRLLEKLTRSKTHGRIRKGPFEGMRYLDRAVGSALIPKLLGIYERELATRIEQACAANFPLIVDIGAAEGYYAVGLARRNPQSRVIAFEMESNGREAIEELAEMNQIQVAGLRVSSSIESSQPQLEIHGKCEFENLEAVLRTTNRSFIICDVEGYEDYLLHPNHIPALERATLLVETHEFVKRGITKILSDRFSATHEVECIWQEPRLLSDFPFQSWVCSIMPKRFIEKAVSEWRPERMCWLWITPKNQA